MKKITVTVYQLSDLEGRAREYALDQVRALCQWDDTAELGNIATELKYKLEKFSAANAEILRRCAEKIGHTFAFDLVEDAIKLLCEEEGVSEAELVTDCESACKAVSTVCEKTKKLMCSFDFYSDDYLIESADIREIYFDSNGEVLPAALTKALGL